MAAHTSKQDVWRVSHGMGIILKGKTNAGRNIRINVGCGATPTEGWLNFDNSMTIRIIRWPWLARLLLRCRIIGEAKYKFVMSAYRAKIRYANASHHIPLPDCSVDVAYSSHMFEHLDRREASSFLAEMRRILKVDGILRIAIPDIVYHIDKYLDAGDADSFVEGTGMCRPRPTGLFGRLGMALTGPRNHLWMYDARSLTRALEGAGFVKVTVLSAGQTKIPDPGRLNLAERSDQSVYVEAVQPQCR